MSVPLLLSRVDLPSVNAKPSSTSLQWSDDGQLFFAAKSKVHVLTPRHLGIASTGDAPDCGTADATSLRWVHTTIEIQRKNLCNWTGLSQEWALLSLGSIDYHVHMVACSPSCLTESGGCIIAVLSSNMDLTLWSALKDSVHGEWSKVYEVTPFLVAMQHNSETAQRRLLQAQITSVAWSGQADFGVSPNPCIDASLLVTGSRAGTLCFLRFDAKLGRMSHIGTLQVSDEWLTHLCFTPWILNDIGFCESWVAYCSSDGAVGLVKVEITGEYDGSSRALGCDYLVKTSFGIPRGDVFSLNEDCTTTALSWIVSGDKTLLVRCRPGVVDLWSPASPPCPWAGPQALYIPAQILTVGSSVLQPVSGLAYFRQHDVLVISLFDGTIRTIRNLFKSPEWGLNPTTHLSSQRLTEGMRSIFAAIHYEDITNFDVNQTSGLISLDGFASVALTQQSWRPADMSVKSEHSRLSHLISVQLCHLDQIHAGILNELEHILTTAKSGSRASPIHILRPIFLWLETFPELHIDMIRTLRCIQWTSEALLLGSFTPWSRDPGSDLRSRFRTSLRRSFYGCDRLFSLRLRLQLTEAIMQCATASGSTPMMEECYETAHTICSLISDGVLRILIGHLGAVTSVLIARDIPFILRVIRQAMQPESPAQTLQEAQMLLNLISTNQPSLRGIDQGRSELAAPLSESCPACGEPVSGAGTGSQSCAQGHVWDYCSISSFLMATPFVRSCVGCQRKTFLPPSMQAEFAVESDWLPPSAQSWIVEELLEAADKCLYCGNTFLTMV